MAGAASVRAGRAYVELEASVAKFNAQIHSALALIRDFGEKATKAGQVGIGIDWVVGTKIKGLIDDYAKFDDQMRIVRATTQGTEKDFEELTKLARKLGATTSFTAQQAAEGMVNLGRAGFNVSEIKDVTGAFLNLSRSTATELPRAIEVASMALRGFNMTGKDAERVADVLSVTANGSMQTLDDLGYSLKFTVPIAREAGLSFEELAKELAYLAQMGLKGSNAATGLRNILTRMTMPNIQKMYKDLGVEVIDKATGNLRTFSDIMTDLSVVLKGMPSGQKLGILNEMMGKFGVAAGASRASGVEFTELFEAIDKAAGRSGQVAEEMDQGIGGAIRFAWSRVTDVFLEFGKVLDGTLKDFMDNSERYTQATKKILNANKDVINDVVKTGIAFAEMNLKFFGAISRFALAHPIIAKLGALFLALSPILLALGTALKGIVGTFNLFVSTMKGVKATLRVIQKIHGVYNDLINLITGVTKAQLELNNATMAYKNAGVKQVDLLNKERKAWIIMQEAQKNWENSATNMVKKHRAYIKAIADVQQAQADYAKQYTRLQNAYLRRNSVSAQLKQEIANFKAFEKQYKALMQKAPTYAAKAYLQGLINAKKAHIDLARTRLAHAESVIQMERAELSRLGALNKNAGLLRRVAEDERKAAIAAYKNAGANLLVARSNHAAAHAAHQRSLAERKVLKDMQAMHAAQLRQKAMLASTVKGNIALVAIVLSVATAYGLFTRSVRRYERAANEAKERIATEQEMLDKKQQTESEQIDKLEELSKKTELNNSEMEYAKTVINELNDAYGDLGLSIDEATGKIKGLTEAQAKLAKEQKEAQASLIEERINALFLEQKAIEKKLKKSGQFGDIINYIPFANGLNWFGTLSKGADKAGISHYWRDIASALWGGQSQKEYEAVLNEQISTIEKQRKWLELEAQRLRKLGEVEEAEKLEKSTPLATAESARAQAWTSSSALFGSPKDEKPFQAMLDEFVKDAIEEFYYEWNAAWTQGANGKIRGRHNFEANQAIAEELAKGTPTSQKGKDALWVMNQFAPELMSKLTSSRKKIQFGNEYKDIQDAQAEISKSEIEFARNLQSLNTQLYDAKVSRNFDRQTEIENQIKDITSKYHYGLITPLDKINRLTSSMYETAQSEYEKAVESGIEADIVNWKHLLDTTSQMMADSADKMSGAFEKCSEDLEDTASSFKNIGTFDNIEALDLFGGNSALLQSERNQEESLKTLNKKVQGIISYLATATDGEYV